MMIKLITKYFNFQYNDITILDDWIFSGAFYQPTKGNVEQGFMNLVQGTNAGDVRFFYFDGHGGSIPDKNGDENDGNDEVLWCSDGYVLDDDLASMITKVSPYPPSAPKYSCSLS